VTEATDMLNFSSGRSGTSVSENNICLPPPDEWVSASGSVYKLEGECTTNGTFGDPHAFGDNIYASLFIERVL
jgi:hypothetical protein